MAFSTAQYEDFFLFLNYAIDREGFNMLISYAPIFNWIFPYFYKAKFY